jgi:iron complex outermembrane receptor protein
MTRNTSDLNRRLLRRGMLPALLAAAPCPATATLAQDTSSGNDAAATDEGVTEVIVTARRRGENLASVPIAITAISAEQLVERSIRTDSDLQLTAPGLTIRQTQGNNSLTYSIPVSQPTRSAVRRPRSLPTSSRY